MGLWSRGIALLLLASVAAQHGIDASPRKALDSIAVDGNQRFLASIVADGATKERQEKRKLVDSKSGKPEQKRHHGNGGKHDSGPEGHHPTKVAVEAKSGKAEAVAVADVPVETAETAPTEAAPVATEAAVSADVELEVDTPVVVAASGKAGKSVSLETGYPTETDAAVAGPHEAKSGKDPAATYEGPHGATHDIVAEAKSGKAGYVMSVPVDAKTGKDPAMSYVSHAKGKGSAADAKSGKSGADEGSSFKPKAEKQLSPYYIKETGHEKASDAKSGKSAGDHVMSVSGKAGKTGAEGGSEGGSESDWWSPSTGSKTSKTMSMETSFPTAPAPATPVPPPTPPAPETSAPTPAVVTTVAPPTNDGGPPPTDLLTLSPTPAPFDNATDGNETIGNETILQVPPVPETRSDPDSNDEPTSYPTYMPTEYSGNQLDAQSDNTRVLEPFGIRLFASHPQPNYDEVAVQAVTKGHLVHSFRARNWEAESLQLMVLEKDRRLLEAVLTQRSLNEHPVYELIFGGVLHFPPNADTPTPEQTREIVVASFQGERLEYYVELLQEAGLDIDKAELDMDLVPQEAVADGSNGGSGGFNWAGLTIGLSAAIVGIGLMAFAGRIYLRRRVKTLDELDLEKGDYAIRLQYTNDEMEALPGTVAETMTGSEDHLSIPSLTKGQQEEVSFMTTPGSKAMASTSIDELASISPLESPAGNRSTPTRYISVFTVKKDCGGKSLEEIDLRALAVAYLSRMLRKFPNTHLLPYDKNAPLPAITNIRNIPDDLDELRQYVGNARIDPKTGKVLFNLRVESDEPVSKMKAGGSSSRSKYKSKAGPGRVTSVKSSDEMEKEEMPRSPGIFEDVKL